MDGNHFSTLSFPLPKGGPKWNMRNIDPEALEKKSFEILNIFPIQMHKEANLTLP